MHCLSFRRLRVATIALFVCISCGTSDPGSICGSERPCVPEGTWVVLYEMASSAQSFSSNTIRIDSEGAEVIGEEVPDNQCTPQDPTPGDLMTSAELSSDGCVLTAEISKAWCQSGETNCEERTITLDFCQNGSTTIAKGSLEACICWATGRPFCTADQDFVTVVATAARAAK